MGAIFDREHEPPEPTGADVAYKALEAAAGLVPGGSQLLNLLITPPLERRRDEWMNEVAKDLRRLATQRGLDLRTLGSNDAFVDAVTTATPAALRTSQQRKLAALRNAVLNSALPESPDVLQQQMFLSLTDRFTDGHLALLVLFHAPRKWRKPDGSGFGVSGGVNPRTLLDDGIPDARVAPALYDQMWSDLHAAGLVRTPRIDNGAEGDVLDIKRTTELGERFLSFITSPLDVR